MQLAWLTGSFCIGGKRGFLAASHLDLAVLLVEAGCQWFAVFAQVAMTTRLTVAGLTSAAPQASEGPSHTNSCGKAPTLLDEMCSRMLITTNSHKRRPVCRVGPAYIRLAKRVAIAQSHNLCNTAGHRRARQYSTRETERLQRGKADMPNRVNNLVQFRVVKSPAFWLTCQA